MPLPSLKLLRKILVFTIVAALAVAVLWRVKRQLVPEGAGVLPFLFQSTSEQSMSSPDGGTLYYRFRKKPEPGHGNYFTWCYTKDLLRGKTVIAEGYSLPAVRKGEDKFPLYWNEGNDFSIQFVFVDESGDGVPSWYSGILP